MRTAKRTPLIHAGRAFVLALAAGLVLVGCMEWSRRNQERDRMGYVASAIGAETYEFMLSEMSKTRVLEAYLIQTSGDYSDFGRVAHVLLREDYVRNVLFAPDGIVDGVFPLEGNEDVVGLNMYGDGAGNLEAQAAIEKEALYIAGPFQLIQGGLGIPAALQMAVTAFSNVFVQSYINHFGADCMSGWTAYTKIDQLMFLPMQSLALSATTFVGQNLGAGDTPRPSRASAGRWGSPWR